MIKVDPRSEDAEVETDLVKTEPEVVISGVDSEEIRVDDDKSESKVIEVETGHIEVDAIIISDSTPVDCEEKESADSNEITTTTSELSDRKVESGDGDIEFVQLEYREMSSDELDMIEEEPDDTEMESIKAEGAEFRVGQFNVNLSDFTIMVL